MPEQRTGQPLPRDLCRRIAQQRDGVRALCDLLAAHARDVMADPSGVDMEALVSAQMVHVHVEAALTQLGHALREAGHDA